MQDSKRKLAIVCALVTGGLAACSSASSSFGDAGAHNDAAHTDARADGVSLRHDGAVADATSDGPTGKDAGLDGHPAPPADASIDTSTCDPTGAPKESPCSITDTIGVFVAPATNGGSDTAGQGTMNAPFATVGYAIANAGGKRVYVCGAAYPEQLTVTANGSVYGGLACPLTAGSTAGTGGVPAWSYTGTLASIAPTMPGYALNVQVVTAATFEDMGFLAQAADPSTAGSSSIAVMLNQATGIELVRVKAAAGAGAAGASKGASPSNWCAATGQGGNAATGTGGGDSGSCACAADTSQGGAGGAADPSTPESGQPGTSSPATMAVGSADGRGGAGAVVIGAMTTSCGAGDPGASGAASAAGAGAAQGTLNGNGWIPATGNNGAPGDPGQGGGGGGGTTALGGAGGGAGGCGGAGGAGGGGGGASFAIAVVNGTVTCSQVTLETATGGAGGAGGAGETGQSGGAPGVESLGCNGGIGGPGAGGNAGNGGSGGPSVGIAVVGVASTVTLDGKAIAPPLASVSMPSSFSPGGGGTSGGAGAPGSAATGGSAGNDGSAGSAGVSAAVEAF